MANANLQWGGHCQGMWINEQSIFRFMSLQRTDEAKVVIFDSRENKSTYPQQLKVEHKEIWQDKLNELSLCENNIFTSEINQLCVIYELRFLRRLMICCKRKWNSLWHPPKIVKRKWQEQQMSQCVMFWSSFELILSKLIFWSICSKI